MRGIDHASVKVYLWLAMALERFPRRTHGCENSSGGAQSRGGGRLSALELSIAGKIARCLGVDVGRLDFGERFSGYGADSRLMTGVLTELSTELGRPLNVTLAWAYPTIAQLAAALERGGSGVTATGRIAQMNLGASTSNNSIAVVGMACRLPGAQSLNAYFDLPVHGRNAIRELPAARFDLQTLFNADPNVPGKSKHAPGGHSGFHRRVRCALFWDIASRSGQMDPPATADSRVGLGGAGGCGDPCRFAPRVWSS
jgi:acyl carrier protein